MTLSDKEISSIRSIFSLIDDEDEQVFFTVRKRLLSLGEVALPYFPKNISFQTPVEKRINEIRDEIIRTVFKNEFKRIKSIGNNDIDLEEGIFLIARQRYPEIVTNLYVDQLNRYAYELKELLSSLTDNSEILRRTISFIAEENNFSGNQIDYYNEDNQYIHKILETKVGVPITISAVYLLIGKRLNLPIEGIGLPGHFILRFFTDSAAVYFDPFNRGKILTRKDCEVMVQNLGFTFTEEYLKPVTNRQIIERMLRNIILSLEKKNQLERIETIRQFIDSLNSDV